LGDWDDRTPVRRAGSSRDKEEPQNQGGIMLRWALIFLVVAIIAAALGFGGIAGDAAYIAKILFYIFIVVFLVSLIMGMLKKR
jgi:uncharacterized membrane protein YtjA (UPF0391 family)